MQSIGQLTDEFVELGRFQGLPNRPLINQFHIFTKSYIFEHAGVEQIDELGHLGAGSLPGGNVVVRYGYAIEIEVPLTRLQQGQQNLGRRGLAATGGPDKSHPRTHGNG